MKSCYPEIVFGLGLVLCFLCIGVLLSYNPVERVEPVAPRLRCVAQNSQDQDDMCIWVHPKDPGQSTIITSDKKADRIFVYDLEGNVLQSVHARHPGNIDVRYSVPLDGRFVDIVAFNGRRDSKIFVYKVEPSTRQLERIDNGAIRTGKNYGGTLYRSIRTGKLYFICTSERHDTEQYELADDGTGKIGGRKVRSWKIGRADSAVADDETGKIYIAEERRGVWEVGGEPGDPTPGCLIIKLGRNGLVGDIEGLALYDLPGEDDYLILSNQRANNFKVYQRSDPHRFVGTFAVQGAMRTVGLEVCNASLGFRFPKGIFVCHSANAGRPVLVTPWETIARSMPETLMINAGRDWREWVAQLSPGAVRSRE